MSRRRTVWASAALTCVAVAMASSALTAVPGIGAFHRLLHPGLAAVGLEQDWRIFAPNPRRTGIRLEATIAWSDGAHTVWRIRRGDPWLSAYADYRWRKWAEHASLDRAAPRLWASAARYIARRLPARPGAVPVELRLIRYARLVGPAGSREPRPWSHVELYRARLG
jgi:hypothetical protein